MIAVFVVSEESFQMEGFFCLESRGASIYKLHYCTINNKFVVEFFRICRP